MTRAIAILLLVFPLTAEAQEAQAHQNQLMTWRRLAPLPDREGFASPFAGLSNGALIVAGGANFPDKKPWEGGTKIYHDRIFVLERPDGEWLEAGKLPHPLAYGVSITAPQGLVCIGGNDAERAYNDVFLLQWSEGKIHSISLPPLPNPVTAAAGAILGSTIYVVGGHTTPNPTDSDSLSDLLALDLDAANLQWTALQSPPGPGRFLSVVGVREDSLYLFSGIRHVAADKGVSLEYLTDAYSYTPGAVEGNRWVRLANLPRANAAVPSPAPLVDGSRFVLLGSGADGGHTDRPMSEHPGFSQTCLIYDIAADAWSINGHTPAPRVCAPAVMWLGEWIIVSGESRPGVRSPEVWAAKESAAPTDKPAR